MLLYIEEHIINFVKQMIGSLNNFSMVKSSIKIKGTLECVQDYFVAITTRNIINSIVIVQNIVVPGVSQNSLAT